MLVGVELTVAIAVVVAVGFAARSAFNGSDAQQAASFNGLVIEPPIPAADFSLLNQRGEYFRLSGSSGKVVVLTFLYTSCTDVCPFVGVKLKQARELLGLDAVNTEFVVVSTDPERDTPSRIAQYSRDLGMYDEWHYLIGSVDELKPVWQAYFVGVPLIGDESEFASFDDLSFFGLLRGLDNSNIDVAEGIRRAYGRGYDVNHPTPVWLIGPDGPIRGRMGQDLTPEELVQDIRSLLAELPE